MQARSRGGAFEGDYQYSPHFLDDADDEFCLGRQKEMTLALTKACANKYDPDDSLLGFGLDTPAGYVC